MRCRWWRTSASWRCIWRSGSTERVTSAVAGYVQQVAERRTDAEFSLIELADYDIPVLTSPVHPMAAGKSYDDPGV